jgi:hypothetical protein
VAVACPGSAGASGDIDKTCQGNQEPRAYHGAVERARTVRKRYKTGIEQNDRPEPSTLAMSPILFGKLGIGWY